MSTLVIYAHPYEESFNASILETVAKKLDTENKKYHVIDLYKDNFNPIYTKEELKLFNEGKTLDSKVEEYQHLIKSSNELIFIFPIWWNDTPAIIKGFLDKVMKKQFAYVDTNTGVNGKLIHIKQTTIITTSSSPTWYLKMFAGNAIQSVFIGASLKQMGIKKTKWINCGNINKIDDEACKRFLMNLQ